MQPTPISAETRFWAGAQLITAIQSIVSRNTDPSQGLVVSVTQVQAGTATNVIPEEIMIAGTIRALNEDVRKLAMKPLEEMVELYLPGP